MNDVTIFNNPEFGQIRTVEMNGEPWFIANDVATVLGYSNPREELRKHVDNEDRAAVTICDGRQIRNVNAINESGLYSLILSSKLPTAKKFKHWVTSEVLPQIRRTGAYVGGNIEEIITKTVAATATAVITEVMKQIIPLITAAKTDGAESSETKVQFINSPASATVNSQIFGVIKKKYVQPGNSKIMSIPEDIKRQVDAMIISGDFSTRQITDYINSSTGMNISNVTLWHYKSAHFIEPDNCKETITYEQITMK